MKTTGRAVVRMALIGPWVDAFSLGVTIVEAGSLAYSVLGGDEAGAAVSAQRVGVSALWWSARVERFTRALQLGEPGRVQVAWLLDLSKS